MPRCYWDRETREWVEYDHLELRARRAQQASGPFVVSDTPGYKSPVGNGWIEGRAARREDLKRSGCREVDPSEYRPAYHSKATAERHGREWLGPKETAKRLPTVVGPNVFAGEQ